MGATSVPVAEAAIERVVTAGLDLLAEGGWADLTVADVARRAGVSVGLVYKRFQDKDDLVFALHEAFLDQVAASLRFDMPTTEVAPRSAIVQLVGQVVGLLRGHRTLLRAFMIRAVADPRVAERASAFTRSVSRRFKAGLLTYQSASGHPSPEVAADVCFRMVYDVTARRIVHGPTFEADLELEWDRLTAELARACAAYFLCPPQVLDA
jgi:AcrR family transcriptional regulator